MKTIYIEIPDGTRAGIDIKNKNEILEKEFQKKYLSCGTTVGYLTDNMGLSVTKRTDALYGYQDYIWANTKFVVGMQYAATTAHQQFMASEVYKKKRYNKSNFDWVARTTPMIIIFEKKEFVQYGKYFEKAVESPTHTFHNPFEFLGEYCISPEHSNKVKINKILVGKNIAFGMSVKKQIRTNIVKLERLGFDVIWLPNTQFGPAKVAGTTGNDVVSTASFLTLSNLL